MQTALPCSGTPQAIPQPPQSAGSEAVSTQAPPQFVVPLGQEVVQVPPAQTWFVPQAWPQPPQFLGSEARSTQDEPHLT